MKTLKPFLLLVAAILSFSSMQAQCPTTFTASDQGFGSYYFYYAFDSINGQDSLNYQRWDFGDGDTSIYNFSSHTYNTSGDYNVCLYFVNDTCSGVICDTIHVDKCTANGYIYTSVLNGLKAKFGVNYGGIAIVSYNWTFQGGDISSSTSNSPIVFYNQSGSYPVSVDIVTVNGCSKTISYTITVNSANAVPCNATFNASPDPYSYNVYFHAVDSSSMLFTYSLWNFGDGTVDSNSNNQSSATHTYSATGTYYVCLTVGDIFGCIDSFCMSVVVNTPVAPPVYRNIYGAISKSTPGTGQGTWAYLIKEDTAGHLVLVNQQYLVDSSGGGNYFFGGLTDGATYYVKGALDSSNADYANYLPTYFGNVLTWGSATPIVLTADAPNTDITLIAGVNPGGPGFIGGWVSQGAGMLIGQVDESRGLGDPLPNVQINLLTANDVPVAFTRTDANGHYGFSNLALGSYKIYAEEINKAPSPANVALTANNPSVDFADIIINSNSAVTGINDIANINIEGVYPNPTTDISLIKFSAKQNSEAKVILSDATGRTVMSNYIALKAGTNEIPVNLSNQASGIYHLSITNNSNKKIIKLVKTQ